MDGLDLDKQEQGLDLDAQPAMVSANQPAASAGGTTGAALGLDLDAAPATPELTPGQTFIQKAGLNKIGAPNTEVLKDAGRQALMAPKNAADWLLGTLGSPIAAGVGALRGQNPAEAMRQYQAAVPATTEAGLKTLGAPLKAMGLPDVNMTPQTPEGEALPNVLPPVALLNATSKAANGLLVNHPDANTWVQEAINLAAMAAGGIYSKYTQAKIVSARAKLDVPGPQEAQLNLAFPDVNKPESLAAVVSDKAVDTRGTLQRVSDMAQLDPMPNISRAGSGDAAIRAGAATHAVKSIAKDLETLGDNAPPQRREMMQRITEIGIKDGILKKVEDILADPKILNTMETLEPINRVHDIAQYEKDVQEAKADPAFVQAVKDHVAFRQHPLDELYEKSKDVDPLSYRAGRGKYFPDLRVNMVRADVAERAYKKYEGTEMDGSKLSKDEVKAVHEITPDRWDIQAKYTMPLESMSMDMYPNLLAILSRRYPNSMMVDLLNEGVAKGWILDRSDIAGGQMPEGLTPHNIQFPYTDEEGLTQYRSRNMFVSPAVKKELQQLRDASYGNGNIFTKIATSVSLATLAEFASHMKNLDTMLVTKVPQATLHPENATPIYAHMNALVGVIKAAREIASDSPEVRSRMAQKAMAGEIRPEYQTSGAWYDKMLSPTHHAIMKVDDTVRYMADKAYDEAIKSSGAPDTLEARSNFVNQVGQYIPQLMNPTIQKLKASGFSPFAVATSAFTRMAARTTTGNVGFKSTNGLDAAKLRTIGLAIPASYMAVSLITNTLSTGNPLGRPGTPLGAIDWGYPPDPKTGKFKTSDPMQLVGMRRFLKGVGAEDLYQGVRAGLPAGRTAKNAFESQKRLATQFAGPAAQLAYESAFGEQIGTRDYNRRQFPEDDIRQVVENMRAAVEKENPPFYAAFLDGPFRAMGYGVPRPEDTYASHLGKKGIVEPLGRATGMMKEVRPALSPAADLAQQYLHSARGTVTPTQEEFNIGQQSKEFVSRLQAAKTDEERKQIAKDMTTAIQNSQMRIKQPIGIMRKSMSNQEITRFLPGIEDMGQLEKVYDVATPDERRAVVDRMGAALKLSVQKGNVTEKDLKQHVLQYQKMIKETLHTGGIKDAH